MLMTIEQIMAECNVGRATATRLAIESGCALPREKKQKYLVKAEAFRRWLNEKKV